MKGWKTVLSALLIVCMIAGIMTITAAAATGGWKSENGVWKYYDGNGVWVSDINGWVEINGRTYYCENGATIVVPNAIREIDGKTYAFHIAGEERGSLSRNIWVPESTTAWLYFGADGAWVEDKNGWVEIDGRIYYCENGKTITVPIREINGRTYAFEGTDAGPATGSLIRNRWVKIGSEGWRYFGNDGAMYMNQWLNYEGQWYYFRSDGNLMTGWLQTGGKYYYLDPATAALKTGLQQINGKWYYFNPSTGALQTGWVQTGGKVYYFSPSTGVLQTGWVKTGGKIYYFSPSTGALQTGWVKTGGKWYYLNPSTGTIKTGWQEYKNNWYYLDPVSGIMVTGTQMINGKTYIFNSYGVLVG